MTALLSLIKLSCLSCSSSYSLYYSFRLYISSVIFYFYSTSSLICSSYYPLSVSMFKLDNSCFCFSHIVISCSLSAVSRSIWYCCVSIFFWS